MAEFTVNPKRFDPYKNFKFRVKWDGRYVAGISKVSGLRRTTEVVHHREGGDTNSSRKSPGLTEFAPITLERSVTQDPEFENWANKVWSLGASRGGEVSLKDFRKDIVLELYNEAGQLVLAYKIYRCWVSEYEVLPDLDANASAIAIEHITLENEGWEQDQSVTEPAEPSFKNRESHCRSPVTITLRGGFIGGLALALCVGVYLLWLWRPEHQVRLHTENFFHAIEHRNWDAGADFIGDDYHDQWGDDRARVLERMREGFRWVRGSRILASHPAVRVETRRAIWVGKITLYSSDDGVMEVLDEHVNKLPASFELEWHRFSGKPWDWKLVRVSNPAFQIPADVPY